MGEEKKLHPVVFYSRKFSTVEINYEIYNKKLLAIVDSCQEWRHFFESTSHQMTIYTDYKNMKYFI